MIEAAAVYWALGMVWVALCVTQRWMWIEPDTALVRIAFVVLGGAIWPLIVIKLIWDIAHGRNQSDL